ncbi:hypothetical protein [Mesorhizobium sp. M0814]|uniref:TetR/AcrR family transcriptional regulator n=1 Tax=Mesorhizobium sp. M0814 TaxID=2957004 RepID=UPI0033378C6E
MEDICQKADFGRSTFYTHYAGKDQLRGATLEAHLQSLNRRMSEREQANRRLFEFSLPMFEHAQAFQSVHHALLLSSGDTIHDQLRERIRRAVRTEHTSCMPVGRPTAQPRPNPWRRRKEHPISNRSRGPGSCRP